LSTTIIDIDRLLPDIFRISNQDRPFFVKVIAHLQKDFFESKIFGRVFDVYKDMLDKYQKPPSEKILRGILEHKGEKPDVVDLLCADIFNPNPISSVEKDYILDKVVTHARKQKMKASIEAAYGVVDTDEHFTDEKFQEVLTSLKDSIKFSIDTELGVDLFDVDERYAKIALALQDKISSGYSQIDHYTGGGFARKELVALTAPPGLGKTIWLVNLGYRFLLGGYNVVHYSMEMGEERLGLRYDGIASAVNIKTLEQMQGIDDVKAAYKKVKMVTKTRLKMKEFPTGAASAYDIEAHLDELELYHEFKPDVIIVDYGDIMKSTKNAKSTYEEQGFIFRELRALGQKKNAVVLTATQSTRGSLAEDGGTKDIVGMADVADSMEKNRILDLLFSVQQTREEKDEGKINLWIAKNRNGESNKRLEFIINYRIMKVGEVQVGGAV